MKVYQTKEIRNLGLVGHGDAGKTSLAACMLYVAGATPRLGRVADGTTVTDYDEEERERKLTMQSARDSFPAPYRLGEGFQRRRRPRYDEGTSLPTGQHHRADHR